MISFKMVGLDVLMRTLERKKKKIQDMKKANARAVVIVDRWIQKNFQEQGKSVGGWRPLSPATLAARRRGGKMLGTKILIDTGEMRKRWKHLYDSKRAVIQSGVDYAEIHEKGLNGIPQRRILPKFKDIKDQLLKIWGDHLKDAINDKF